MLPETDGGEVGRRRPTKCLSADRQFSKSQVPSKLSLLPAQQPGQRGQGRYP